ncbi:Elongator subunit elp2 [Elasticomyces elasticus]|nr:Elongator subunit elp2 [Elasticomyces elasticus]
MSNTAPEVAARYLAAGGNRHPAAADWAPGLLAFGAGNNIALWNPQDTHHNGISALLAGHTDAVNAVKVCDLDGQKLILSGSADKTVRVWKPAKDKDMQYEQLQCLAEHQGSVNTISVLPRCKLFATGAADSNVKIWTLTETGAKLVQSISLQPRYLPLTTALISLAGGAVALAVAGTASYIQLYVRSEPSANFVLQATLTGHEGWIRSLDFVAHGEDILLASASQDKYIRLWRLRRETGTTTPTNGFGTQESAAVTKKYLSNTARQVGNTGARYAVTFEALLIGHEDWIYTARWAPSADSRVSPTLLSASADNSVAIWTADEASGVWLCNARLGEISAQKGSTTATGSTGGFWIGLWQPDGSSVVSLGRTGSWRRWTFDGTKDTWNQQLGISGHTQEVQSLAWAPDSSYLLTTGSDQTTRLFAAWKRDDVTSWHEFARPQIHGYDLNCIDSISANQFISGADEKLLRVFNKPKAIDNLLSKLAGTDPTTEGLADAANIPVLGLSNKAIASPADDQLDSDGIGENADAISTAIQSPLNTDQPTLEDHLARHTLWPEHEKLYGHGYEISAVAASHDGTLVATACKASSLDHAVIRLYDTKEWREVKPALTAHSLTVARLAFSADDQHLLSVGRDRQWAVFKRKDTSSTVFELLTSNPKAHARMILDCDWAPASNPLVFATAGRDKCVKIWTLTGGKAECVLTITLSATVTAVAFSSLIRDDGIRLAAGTEDGSIHLIAIKIDGRASFDSRPISTALCPSGSISCLQWRPARMDGPDTEEIAVASSDHSVRILATTK